LKNASIIGVYWLLKVLFLLKDYEDDFDDDEEDKSGEEGDAEENLREIPFSRTSEIEEIQRAISAENDRICTSLPKKTEDERKEPIIGRQVDTSIFLLNLGVTHTTYE